MSLVVIGIATAWVCALRPPRRGCGSTSEFGIAVSPVSICLKSVNLVASLQNDSESHSSSSIISVTLSLQL